MATNLSDMNLENLVHVSEVGALKNPASSVPIDVNGETGSDQFVEGLNVNDSEAPEGGVVTLRKDVVVQNENGLETISLSGADIDLSKPTGNDDSLGVDIKYSHVDDGVGEVTLWKEVVVQNETGLETISVGAANNDLSKPTGIDISLGVDIEYSHVDDGAGDDGEDVVLPEVQKPSYSEESNSSAASKPDECESGETDGLEDFKDALEEMDAEVGYPDNVDYMEEVREYSVGDLVWGKIRSHPWWPGQIYAPDDASTDANKFNQKGRHLVAYYGDESFSWCLPSQLIPFAEHFEEMSVQSSSKVFIRAVQQAVDEIGRLVELEMTCSCVPDENRKDLTRPLAVNAGIRSGVLVPEGDIGKLLSFRYDSSEVLVTVASIAKSVSFASALELSILKGWLSAVYRARGGFTLPLYREPVFVMGLDDGSGQINVQEQNDFSIPIEVPLQGPLKEGLVSPATAGGHVYQGDEHYHRRKQKSETGLKKETDVIPKGRTRDTSGEGSDASDIVNRKRKSDNNIQVLATGMRQDKNEKDEILNTEIGDLRKEKMQDRSLSSELNMADIPSGEKSSGEGAKGYEEMSSIRQRRKSKYLSPPFTIPTSSSRYPSYEQAAESEEKSKFARMGERIKAVAEQLFESSASINHVGTTSKKSERYGVNQADTSADLLPQSGLQYPKKFIEAVDAVASVNEVLSELLSVASSPLGPWNSEMLKLTREFLSAFRSFKTPEEAIYSLCNKRKRKRERNSLNLPDGDSDNSLNQTGSTGARKRKEKLSSSKTSNAEKSYTPKRKKAARVSSKEGYSVGLENNASLTSSLVLTIPPGFSLPSKDEIINTFSKYGHVSEEETVVFSNSCRVKIEHVHIAGVESALRELLRQNPFGSATVDYKICYSSAAPVAVASNSAAPVAVASNSAAPTAVASDLASDGMPHLGSNAQT